MSQHKSRTQFRVNKDVYTPVEGIRKEYERYRFLHHQDAKRVTTEVVVRTLLEHAGVLPMPKDPGGAARHIDVMRIIAHYHELHAPSAHAPKAAESAEAA